MGFTKIRTTDQNLSLVQDNVSLALEPLQQAPLTGGNFITDIDLQIGINTIAHQLKKVPTRWIVCDSTAGSTIYRASWDAQFINLQSSAVTTIALWVA